MKKMGKDDIGGEVVEEVGVGVGGVAEGASEEGRWSEAKVKLASSAVGKWENVAFDGQS